MWLIYPTGLGRWDEQIKIIGKKAKEWPWRKKKNVAFFRGSRTSDERSASSWRVLQSYSLFGINTNGYFVIAEIRWFYYRVASQT